MIELIFVIVILGILAAVALPKFIGVSEQAKEGKIKAFVGTMNRTVGPTLWSKSIAMGKNGKIYDLNISTKQKLEEYTEVPSEVAQVNLQNCASADSDTPKVAMTLSKDAMGTNYVIGCIEGNIAQAPKFSLYKTGDTELSLGNDIPDGTYTQIQ
jgi:type II secretory pathway pseudopilin PulG